MDIEYFREFTVLVDTKNYWEASARLFIGQSTLTKHIKQMEKELGVPLFNRTSRKVELTEYGKLLIPYAHAIMDAKFELSEEISLVREAANGSLLLGVLPSMVQYHITDLLIGFQKSNPGNVVKVQEEDTIILKGYLREGKVELAFLRESNNWPVDDGDLIKIPYLNDKLVALLPLTHPLANEKYIRLEQLQKDKFVLLKQQTLMYQICMNACQVVGFKPQVAFDCHRIDSILDLVSQGLGVGLLMDRHIGRYIQVNHSAEDGTSSVSSQLGFVTAEILPEITSTIYLCHRKQTVLSETAKRFIKYVTHSDSSMAK